MPDSAADPFANFKALQRDAWASFVPVEIMTTAPAAKLVQFAQVQAGQRVLDVACGTGVVAITAALRGTKVAGLDLTPALIERARKNAALAGVDVDFIEGDAESLPYPDGSFDVVLSQFGHIFAPRPAVVVGEMLRVLKKGGRIAFSTWPPEHAIGQMFALVARNLPPPPAGGDLPAPPPLWGDPNVIRERLGAAVTRLTFARGVMAAPAMSLNHFRAGQEATVGPLTKLVASLEQEPAKLAKLREDFDAIFGDVYADNLIRVPFLMTRASKA
jgi:SAM-dependent methyltransferase